MNLLQLLLKTLVSTQSVNSVSKKTGLSQELVTKLIITALPILIKYMTKNASSQSGALSLANARTTLFREGPREYVPDDSWVDYKIIDDVLIATTVIEIQSDAAVTREALQGG